MERLEHEADVDYESLELAMVAEVTARVFASMETFAARSDDTDGDPTMTGADARRREALVRAVRSAAPQWSRDKQESAAGVIDVLWSYFAYERLISKWCNGPEDASAALVWAIEVVIAAITEGNSAPDSRNR